MKGKWAIAVCLVLSMVLIPSALAGASQTIVVAPTNDDDTANIQAALNEAAEHPGSVIQLTAGDFYLSDPVIVYNFSGTIRGQGKDKTTIHNKPDVLFGLVLDDPAMEWWYGVPMPVPYMFNFRYTPDAIAELHVESLGFHLVGKSEWWPYWGGDPGGDLMGPFTVEGIEFGTPSNVSTTWVNLRSKGDASDDYIWGKNMMGGIGALVNLSGTHVVSGCDFQTSWGESLSLHWLDHARVQVGGPRPEDRVLIEDSDLAGIYANTLTNSEISISNVRASDLVWNVLSIGGHSNSKVYMTNVETYNASGAMISPWGWFGPTEQPSTFLFEHNTIRQPADTEWAGFEIHEDSDVKSNIVIRNNRISGEGSFLWGPIFTLGARNAVITNNQITGSGPAAMYLGPWGFEDNGLMVKGNNVQGWTVDSTPCGADCEGLPLAPIWLGWDTSGNTVVGSGNLRTTVFDETDNPDTPAYDGRNILVGVNSQGAQVGQAIRDAMQARIAAKKLLMDKMPR